MPQARLGEITTSLVTLVPTSLIISRIHAPDFVSTRLFRHGRNHLHKRRFTFPTYLRLALA